jgi:hypothetical protein
VQITTAMLGTNLVSAVIAKERGLVSGSNKQRFIHQ